MRTGRMNEGVGGVPKLPASDDQSVHSPGLTGARRNNGAGRTKKKKNPPWESAFPPVRRRVMDWTSQLAQCGKMG